MRALASVRAQAIQPSPTLALAAEAKARRARGEDVVGFGAGEPDFDTPDYVKDAAIRALGAGCTKYTPTGGLPELKRAIQGKFARENGLDYRPEELLVSCGAKQSLYNLFQATLDPGDEVVIPSPYWVSYPDMARLAGAEPRFAVATEATGFCPTAEVLERALTPKTRLLILNSPCNPTGALLDRRLLGEIAELLAPRTDLLVGSDDIYERLLYGDEPFANLLTVAPGLRERTVLVNGVSKTFAMTGWRIGYAAGPVEIMAAMGRIQDQSTSCPTSFAQWGAVAALDGSGEEPERMRLEFDRRRRRMVALLREIPGVACVEPLGAFYAFPSIVQLLSRAYRGERVETDVRFCQILLDRGVAAVPGEPFGAPGHVRLSFALGMEELEKGISRLAAFAAELRTG